MIQSLELTFSCGRGTLSVNNLAQKDSALARARIYC